MTTCGTCGVTIEWKPWPADRRRPAWLGDAEGYWLDPWGQRFAYESGRPQFEKYRHDHAPKEGAQ